jgi:hypothetical protein
MRLKVPPMKTKFAMLLALAALVVGGNARAGVVGISPTITPTTGSSATIVNILTFNTTGLGGLKISGLSLYGNGNSNYDNVSIQITGGSYAVAGFFNIGSNTTSSDELLITWGSSNGVLEAGETYTVSLSGGSGGGIDAAEFYRIGGSGTPNPYSVNSSVSNYLSGPVAGSVGAVAINLYYDTTSVPEPGTMILTGTALAAGAVGAYFKRRRKAKVEVAA